jgi:hypothetical protein
MRKLETYLSKKVKRQISFKENINKPNLWLNKTSKAEITQISIRGE